MLIRRQRIAIEAAVLLVVLTWLIIYTVYAIFAVTNPSGHTANYPWNPWQLATIITAFVTSIAIAITPLLGRRRSETRVALSAGFLVLLAAYALRFVGDKLDDNPLIGDAFFWHAAEPTNEVCDLWETVALASLAFTTMTVASALLLRCRRMAAANRVQSILVSGGLCLIAVTCLFPNVRKSEVHKPPLRQIAAGGGTINCSCGSVRIEEHFCHSFLFSVDGAIMWGSLLQRWTMIATVTIGVVLLLRIRNQRRIIQQPALAP